jgi:methylated-DNA-[protein]-cysteine S-methyltransferase
MDAHRLTYVLLDTTFGMLGLIWQQADGGVKVQRVLLPTATIDIEHRIRQYYHTASPGTSPTIADLCDRIRAFLRGQPVAFDVGQVNLDLCSQFQRRALLAEHGVPRGWVSTYGRIARYICTPGAARAVGRALSQNPFPIIIPCHRAIRGDGRLGGFQGGEEMKRRLLELEGVQVSPTGRVSTPNLYY